MRPSVKVYSSTGLEHATEALAHESVSETTIHGTKNENQHHLFAALIDSTLACGYLVGQMTSTKGGSEETGKNLEQSTTNRPF